MDGANLHHKRSLVGLQCNGDARSPSHSIVYNPHKLSVTTAWQWECRFLLRCCWHPRFSTTCKFGRISKHPKLFWEYSKTCLPPNTLYRYQIVSIFTSEDARSRAHTVAILKHRRQFRHRTKTKWMWSCSQIVFHTTFGIWSKRGSQGSRLTMSKVRSCRPFHHV